MKNLFKSLMLVAVAAMAFTACQNEPEVIVNNGAESTTITFDATFADTRSQFGEKVEGEGYPSTWTGNEEAIFTHTTYCYSDGAKYVSNTESGAEARFVVEYNGYEVAPAANATIVAVTPSSAWTAAPYYDYNISFSPIAWEHTYTIPTQQTPSANSVDEAAHILKATVNNYDASGRVNLTFEHQVAYGKLSLQNYDGTNVTSVVLDINGTKYTINTTAMENIWFACEPATVQNMTVSVNATEGAYTKQIVTGGDKELVFTKGRVSTFTVDFYGVTTGEVIDTFNPTYLYNSLVWDSANNRFKLTGDGVNEWRIYLNEADRPNNNSIIVGTYTGCGSNAPTQGQFGAEIRLSYIYVSHFSSASTLDVTFADNVYTIVLTHNGSTYGYKGMPDGWTAPGKVKTALATPEVTAEVVDDKNVTVTWNEVANAANYTVSVNGVVKEAANTSRTYTIEGTYSTEYTITVVANPAADSEDYKASAAGSATVTTNDDPNAEEPEQPGEGGGEEPEQPAASYENWVFNMTLSTGTGALTLTDGEHTVSATLKGVYGLGVGSYVIGDTSGIYYAIDVQVNGTPATSAEGSFMLDNSYKISIDATINGVKYTGTSTNGLF